MKMRMISTVLICSLFFSLSLPYVSFAGAPPLTVRCENCKKTAKFSMGFGSAALYLCDCDASMLGYIPVYEEFPGKWSQTSWAWLATTVGIATAITIYDYVYGE